MQIDRQPITNIGICHIRTNSLLGIPNPNATKWSMSGNIPHSPHKLKIRSEESHPVMLLLLYIPI